MGACTRQVAWQRVFVGTRHTTALCYLCVCSPCQPPPGRRPFLFSPSRLVARAGRLAAWHDMVTYLRSWWRCVACLLFVCMRRHTFCPLSLPFASYVSGRAGGGWARLGYALWSPFTFVGVVAVLVSCSLRSVAWHATYLDPTSHVCMFSFCLCVFFCVLCFTSVARGLLRAFSSPLSVSIQVHPLSTSTTLPSPAQDDCHTYGV